MTVRPAVPEDVPVLLQLVRELAEYEREPDAVEATEDDLRRGLFEEGTCAAHVALDAGGEVVGFALWYPTFSTWTGRPGLLLEDLFVRDRARGRGVGRRLLVELARVAVARGCPRLELSVLDWNPARRFYEGLGFRWKHDWLGYRLDGDRLAALAASGP